LFAAPSPIILRSMRHTQVQLDNKGELTRTLRARVDAYFESSGKARDGGPAMVRKAAGILAWWFASWATFVLVGTSAGWAAVIALSISMGTAMAAMGMAVQHDGGHQAFAATKGGNRWSAAVLDLLGASSYVWKVKHGFLHHTYPNVVGADDDIALEPLARFAPTQPRYSWHRFQHLYMWVLYGFIGLKWWLIDDFRELASGRVGSQPVKWPRGLEAGIFWGGKLVHGLWAVVIPGVVVGWGPAIAFYVGAQFVMGVLLSVTFQLAHCVEEADFVDPERLPAGQGPLVLDYARHQLATTVDFARHNRWVTWFVGGLNYQAVHHLFPRVCHLHYPALSPIVAEVCRDFDVEYKTSRSVRASVASHYRWLRRMGREDASSADAHAPVSMAA
jgi:linoleoyl-CoA desaturase